MSTRCQIGIYDNEKAPMKDFEVLLYRHCDGYPEGTLQEIVEFCLVFDQNRGLSDGEYLGARLIQHLCNQADMSHEEMRKELGQAKMSRVYDFLSYGVCKGFHGDIEFFYRINSAEKTVQVFECPFGAAPQDYELVETIKVKDGWESKLLNQQTVHD